MWKRVQSAVGGGDQGVGEWRARAALKRAIGLPQEGRGLVPANAEQEAVTAATGGVGVEELPPRPDELHPGVRAESRARLDPAHAGEVCADVGRGIGDSAMIEIEERHARAADQKLARLAV